MCVLPGDTMTTPKNTRRNGAFTVNTKIKNTLLILLVMAFVLAGCAATMEDDFLPDTEALPFATPTSKRSRAYSAWPGFCVGLPKKNPVENGR